MKILLILLSLFLFVSAQAQTKTGEYRTFIATAYAHKGITASGHRVRKGIIAADPKVLKLGTRVHIEGMGEFVVADTGGAIKGLKVDIWFSSRADCIKFGRRKIKLKILGG